MVELGADDKAAPWKLRRTGAGVGAGFLRGCRGRN